MLFFLSLTQNPPPWSWEAGQPWCGAVLELHCVLVLTSPRWALHCPRASISYWAGSRWKWKTSSVMAAKHRSTATSAPRPFNTSWARLSLKWRLTSWVWCSGPPPSSPGDSSGPVAGWLDGRVQDLSGNAGWDSPCLLGWTGLNGSLQGPSYNKRLGARSHLPRSGFESRKDVIVT